MSNEGVNYFIVRSCQDMGNAMVMLELAPKYGSESYVAIPMSGAVEWYPIGSEVELMARVTKNAST